MTTVSWGVWFAVALIIAVGLSALVVYLVGLVEGVGGGGGEGFDGQGGALENQLVTLNQRVTVSRMALPRTATEFTDRTQLFGHSVDASADGATLFATSGTYDACDVKRFARQDAGTYALSGASAVAWPPGEAGGYDHVGMSLSPDGSRVCLMVTSSAAGRGRLAVLEASSMTTLSLVEVPAAMSPNERAFRGPTAASDGTLRWLSSDGTLWRAGLDGTPAALVRTGVLAYAHTPDGDLVVEASTDGKVSERRAGSDKVVRSFTAPGFVTNLVVSQDGLRVCMAVRHDAEATGAFYVYHRTGVDDPWLKTSPLASERGSGRVEGDWFGSSMRVFGSDYLLVAGVRSERAEVWHLNAVVGTPTYFYEVYAGHAPSARAYISPSIESTGRVWMAVGSSARWRYGDLQYGRVTAALAEVKRTTQGVNEANVTAEGDGGLTIPQCASADWRSGAAEDLFSIGAMDVDRDSRETTPFAQVALCGDRVVHINRRVQHAYFPTRTYNDNVLVMFDRASGAVLYESAYNDHAIFTSTGVADETRYVKMLTAGVGQYLVCARRFRSHSDVCVLDTLNPGGPPVSRFDVPWAYGRAVGAIVTDDGRVWPWVASSSGGFQQYDDAGEVRQTMYLGEIKIAASSGAGRTVLYTTEADASSYPLRVYAHRGGGEWVAEAVVDTGTYALSALNISVDGVTIVAGDGDVDMVWQGGPTLYDLVTDDDAHTARETSVYKHLYSLSKRRAHEHAFVASNLTYPGACSVCDGKYLYEAHENGLRRFAVTCGGSA